MGPAFVLLFWAVIGLILSAVASAFLAVAVWWFTRRAQLRGYGAIVAAAAFPFACLAWTGVVVVAQGIVNVSVFGRDLGFGDTWQAPLPNGYRVQMIDVTDRGCVYNPKTQPYPDSVVSQDDAVFGVRTLQVAGPYLFGGCDTRAMERMANNSGQIDSYFMLDARTGKVPRFRSLQELRHAVTRAGARLKLEPIMETYSRYRGTWFDVVVGIIWCAPIAVGAALILRWVLRIRRSILSSVTARQVA